MLTLGVGIDTGRYGHHVTFLREDKQPACPPMIAMETRTGYEQLRSQLERLRQRFPHAQIYLRIDVAGQYAANLESFLRSLTHLSMKISIGEPKRNKDYHSAHAPKSQSDATESHAMARYAVVERPEESHGTPPQFAVLRRVASRLQSQTKQSTRLINQLHETLSVSFPELATLINDLAANWVLLRLEKYPTSQRLADARLVGWDKRQRRPTIYPAPAHHLSDVGGLRSPGPTLRVPHRQELTSRVRMKWSDWEGPSDVMMTARETNAISRSWSAAFVQHTSSVLRRTTFRHRRGNACVEPRSWGDSVCGATLAKLLNHQQPEFRRQIQTFQYRRSRL